ncbi:lipopolysaccharide/colanic/teichoic acid biosynthesis glycosyltransferase [Paraburkholderia tropica]|uniref:sugar transferase n=1 Tax=Paraburkholderia tropica TaxID=92647 RepID=UPI001622DA64|nr:sugar transferase [Paraburkholderia tropica]MBB3003258.1 lipopolysaccharide/colanic/teichoic acid biosynthesis glycosyltransferase [Paraburkholderia tropica]MBB6322274.1 lipopolysaccharide/colanic/teichoic acid biosynthesis glycosyltransferase [Paraburkholderia tropica]
MSRILPRTIDVMLVILGALLPVWINTSNGSRHDTFDGLLVAFAAAFALSVFPACGIYRALQRSSVVRLIAKTLLGWILVQCGSLLLLQLLRRPDVLSGQWFYHWTIASACCLVAWHTLTFVALRVTAKRPVTGPHASATGQSATGALPIYGNNVGRSLKRVFDIVVASLLLFLLSPILVVLAVLVRRDGAPAIFGHLRVGYDGTPFRCFKFRSMVPNAEAVLQELLANDTEARIEWDREHKLKNDVRITTVGKFLRRTSLDELPQLLNVLRGDMSLVGPRPIVVAELPRYGRDAEYYLSVKPGMTGLWQVSGRNNTDYPTRVRLDVSYIRNWSFFRDLHILLKTFDVVLHGRGAY